MLPPESQNHPHSCQAIATAVNYVDEGEHPKKVGPMTPDAAIYPDAVDSCGVRLSHKHNVSIGRGNVHMAGCPYTACRLKTCRLGDFWYRFLEGIVFRPYCLVGSGESSVSHGSVRKSMRASLRNGENLLPGMVGRLRECEFTLFESP